jgi:hypothetical protein
MGGATAFRFLAKVYLEKEGRWLAKQKTNIIANINGNNNLKIPYFPATFTETFEFVFQFNISECISHYDSAGNV